MRPTRWILCAAILGCCFLGSASAQEAVRWQVNLETAKRLALQTNRPVLIHFWADWCEACKQMEQEVYVRPDVASALDARFVPVRINVDHFPETSRQYGVSVLPCDVIITPQGQLVAKIEGKAAPPDYFARLGQAANSATQLAAASQGPAPFGPGPPTARAPQGPPLAGPPGPRPNYEQPIGPPRYSNDRYAGHFGPQQQGPVSPTGADYAAPAGPNSGGPPPSSEYGAGAPRVAQTSPALGWQGAAAPMAATSPQVPPGNPSLALAGYCPVRLAESECWVPGDPRWGLVHEGRTYLFAGPAERDRFDAEPDRYAPVLAGNDLVLLVEEGRTVPGRREHGAWFEGQPQGRFEKRVYLFSSEGTLERFDADPYRYVSRLTQAAQAAAGVPSRQNLGPDNRTPGNVPVEATRAPYQRSRY
ncbi:MAG: thioredoxin family protein [Planctomycetota bacterium]